MIAECDHELRDNVPLRAAVDRCLDLLRHRLPSTPMSQQPPATSSLELGH
jgi:hypothetical protein